MHTKFLQFAKGFPGTTLVLILGPQHEALIEKSQISKGQGQMDTPLKGDAKGRRRMPG